MAFDMSKYLSRFLEEAREHIAKLNDGLVQLEKMPDDSETINAVFRSAHTIKGSSRMMKLTHISELAHKLEDALGALREKKIQYSGELADLLLSGIDSISDMIDKTAAGQEITADNAVLYDKLSKAASGTMEAVTSKPAAEKNSRKKISFAKDAAGLPEAPVPAPPVPDAVPAAPGGTRPKASETVRINLEKLDELIKLMGEIVSNQNRSKQRLSNAREVERAAKKYMKLLSAGEHKIAGDYRDKLFDAGQSLLLKIKDLASNIKDDSNINELLTNELQETALKMRMVPLSIVFNSFHRMVRDIARTMGKDVDFSVEGGDIELDKKMIDKIGDPLVHMLRNSVDHGIESPGDRLKAGKTEKGHIKLSAYYDSGSVVIELSDDGNGIPLEKIKEKALRKKMFEEGELNSMSESELIDLIFHPGFSTSAIITDVSGRGVGMDIVKRDIVEGLRGAVRIETEPGRGTAFYIRIPMTLAVMRILLVTISGTVFGIISHYVSEIINVPESELIDVVSKKAIRFRNEFIPVVRLENFLKLQNNGGHKTNNLLVIIVNVGDEKLGLVADALLDEEDMVIKSLPAHMKNIQLVSGVTISGKNEIISILHIPAFIGAAREIKETKFSEAEAEEAKSINILVVDDSVNTREIEKSILEAYGYKVTLAGDGLDALEKARAFKYDLVITDIEMPRLNGFLLTERLRNDDSYKYTPIIIMTSREKDEDKKRGISVGADAYIVKGAFDQSNLLETVRNLAG